MRSAMFLFLFCALCLIAASSAWTFTWVNGSGFTSIEEGDSPRACSQIDHAKGKEFVWNPADDGLWFWIWSNSNCSGSFQGHSEIRWPRVASEDFHSFMVDTPDHSLKSTPIPSATSRTSTTPVQTSTTSPTETFTGLSQSSESGSSLSGGAIAGIVIGVVAGVAFLAGAFFFFGWRRKGTHKPTHEEYISPGNIPPSESMQTSYTPTSPYPYSPTGTAPSGPLELHPDTSPISQELASPSKFRRVPGRDLAELASDNGPVEMSDSQRVHELEGQEKTLL